MDGPSVNVKLHQVVRDDRKDKGFSHLLDIGTCGLGILQESFKTGIEKSEWEMKSLMKASLVYFMTLQLDGMTMKVWQNLQISSPFLCCKEDGRCDSCR